MFEIGNTKFYQRLHVRVTTVLLQLEWPPLKERRQQAGLMFSKALTNDSAISLFHLSHPSRTTRTLDETCFIPIPLALMSTNSLFSPAPSLPGSLHLWNSAQNLYKLLHGRKSPIGHGAPAVMGSPVAGLLTEAPMHPTVLLAA
jgi:hypothetical protein